MMIRIVSLQLVHITLQSFLPDTVPIDDREAAGHGE